MCTHTTVQMAQLHTWPEGTGAVCGIGIPSQPAWVYRCGDETAGPTRLRFRGLSGWRGPLLCD